MRRVQCELLPLAGFMLAACGALLVVQGVEGVLLADLGQEGGGEGGGGGGGVRGVAG